MGILKRGVISAKNTCLSGDTLLPTGTCCHRIGGFWSSDQEAEFTFAEQIVEMKDTSQSLLLT